MFDWILGSFLRNHEEPFLKHGINFGHVIVDGLSICVSLFYLLILR